MQTFLGFFGCIDCIDKFHPKTPPTPNEWSKEGERFHPTCVDQHATDWIPYTPDLLMRPVARIIQELPPSLAAYRVRFPSAPPRLGCLLSCGVRSSEMKKAVTTALGRNLRVSPKANACVTAFTLLLSTTTNSLYHKKLLVVHMKQCFL